MEAQGKQQDPALLARTMPCQRPFARSYLASETNQVSLFH